MERAAVLVDDFDVNSLPSGLYVAASDAPAYALLRGMALSGMAKLEGERYIDGGRKAVTVRVRSNGQDVTPNARKRMRLDPTFYRGPLEDYKDWPLKWWREVVQNSVDAKATQIELNTVVQDDGSVVVSCTDNGKGMSPDIMDNKFLVFGATTKETESGDEGGFGKAKELLVLPWLSWRIESNGWMFEGVHDDYDDEPKRSSLTTGTRLTVHMPADCTTTAYKAKALIERCTVPRCTFLVNGTTVAASAERGKILDTAGVADFGGKAKAYYNETSPFSGLFVRSKGVFMFEAWMPYGIPGALFVEIVVKSITVLQSNRDGFRDDTLEKAVGHLQSRMSKDTSSAIKKMMGKSTTVRERHHGVGVMEIAAETARIASANILAAMPPLPAVHHGDVLVITNELAQQVASAVEEATGDWFVAGEETEWGDVATVGQALAQIMVSGTELRGQQQMENVVSQLAWKPDFLTVNEVEGYRVPKKFHPTTMAPMILKLAKTWVEICRYVLMQLNFTGTFGGGFVFTDKKGSLAEYANDEGENWILLNPFARLTPQGRVTIDRTGKPMSHASLEDLKLMYSLAVHEATHMVDGLKYHDEDFSSAAAKNVALCADGFKNARKIAQVIGKRGAGKGARPAKTTMAPAQKKMSPDVLAAWEFIAYAAAAYVANMRGDHVDRVESPSTPSADSVQVGPDRFSASTVAYEIFRYGRYASLDFSLRVEMGSGENDVYLIFHSDDTVLRDWWDSSGLDIKTFSITYNGTAYSITLGR
jgi:hypothetical protein